uniref:Uncharacterized protein n=1 Tax=Anopheles atroparvus TaxID=41427 RepID=A0AAG5DHI7_ANOAO
MAAALGTSPAANARRMLKPTIRRNPSDRQHRVSRLLSTTTTTTMTTALRRPLPFPPWAPRSNVWKRRLLQSMCFFLPSPPKKLLKLPRTT